MFHGEISGALFCELKYVPKSSTNVFGGQTLKPLVLAGPG